MSTLGAMPERLLDLARAGDDDARGQLLDHYRNYLRVLARALNGKALQARLDDSDLVQETFLKAHRQFNSFKGSCEPELVAWLRQILVNSATDLAKKHRVPGRDFRREESLEALLERSSLELQDALAVPLSSPSERASQHEQAVLLANALQELPDDYREVFVMRNLEHVPMEEIAIRMNRSLNAVRKLWARALLALQKDLEEKP